MTTLQQEPRTTNQCRSVTKSYKDGYFLLALSIQCTMPTYDISDLLLYVLINRTLAITAGNSASTASPFVNPCLIYSLCLSMASLF